MGIVNSDQQVYVLNILTNKGEVLKLHQGDILDIYKKAVVSQRVGFKHEGLKYETWMGSLQYIDLDLYN